MTIVQCFPLQFEVYKNYFSVFYPAILGLTLGLREKWTPKMRENAARNLNKVVKIGTVLFIECA